MNRSIVALPPQSGATPEAPQPPTPPPGHTEPTHAVSPPGPPGGGVAPIPQHASAVPPGVSGYPESMHAPSGGGAPGGVGQWAEVPAPPVGPPPQPAVVPLRQPGAVPPAPPMPPPGYAVPVHTGPPTGVPGGGVVPSPGAPPRQPVPGSNQAGVGPQQTNVMPVQARAVPPPMAAPVQQHGAAPQHANAMPPHVAAPFWQPRAMPQQLGAIAQVGVAAPQNGAMWQASSLAPAKTARSGKPPRRPVRKPQHATWEERRRRSLRIGVTQVVCWQVAAIIVIAAVATGGLGRLIAAVALALLALAVSSVAVRGKWLHQWILIAARYLHRQRRIELPDTDRAATELVRPWLGETSVGVTVVRDQPLALVSHHTAVSALLRLGPSGTGGAAIRLLGESSAVGVLDDQPVAVDVQLVVHAGLRHDHEPRRWLAVAACRSPELSTDEQLVLVLRNAVRRMQRQVEHDGWTADAVGDREAATTVVALAHAGAGRGHVRERWSTWSAGPVTQACLRLTGFTKLDQSRAAELHDSLTGTVTGAAVTVAVGTRTRSDGSRERHEPVLRVAASSAGALDAAVTVLTRLARVYGVDPERLDGRHGLGTATSLPIARTLV